MRRVLLPVGGRTRPEFSGGGAGRELNLDLRAAGTTTILHMARHVFLTGPPGDHGGPRLRDLLGGGAVGGAAAESGAARSVAGCAAQVCGRGAPRRPAWSRNRNTLLRNEWRHWSSSGPGNQ